MIKRKKTYFVYFICLSALLFGFNNCSPSSFVPGESFSSTNGYRTVCDGQLKAAFQRTYHPFLQANCVACHSTAQGSPNLNVAFNAFSARGENLIDYQATHAHGGNSFSSAMQPQIDAFKPSWTTAKEDHADCLIEGASQGGGNSSGSLVVTGKVLPNILPTADNNNWVTVEWDLETEVEPWAVGKFKAKLKVEAKLNKVGGVISGLFIRNPAVQLNSGSANISVSGMMINIGGQRQQTVTTYSGISQIVSLTTFVPLVNSSAAAYSAYNGFQATTTVGFDFNEVKHTNAFPDPIEPPIVDTPIPVELPEVPIPDGGVTFAQLNSNSSPYRVFNRSCTGCHNSGSGRLDLTNYMAARAAATLILSRMNDTVSPMPATGQLRKNDRDMVQSWVNSGTPER